MNPDSHEAVSKDFPDDAGGSLARELRRQDLERGLARLHRKGGRHLIWALLGCSPAAIIPALGLAVDGSEALLIPLMVLVTLTQGFAFVRTRSQARELGADLAQLQSGPSTDRER